MKLQWFRFETRVSHLKEPFVDWYYGPIEHAKECHAEDCHRYGVKDYTVTFREATPEENERMNRE